ncbi:MAG: PEP-CTERM sorting domain-containing protein [Microcoleaceae cyanobacterium]
MKISLTLLTATLTLSLPLKAVAEVRGLNSLFLEDLPTEDLTDSDFDTVPNGFIRPVPSDSPDVSDSTATVTGFTTDISTVTSVGGPIRLTDVVTFPAGLEPPAGDVIRNVWGFQGPEIAGVDAVLGTNVGAGLDNAGATGDPDNPIQPFNVFYDQTIVGAAGDANDFFLIDIIGDDAVELQPIDAAGNVIGDFALQLASGPGGNNFANSDLGDFGLTGLDLSLFLENGSNIGLAEETVIDDVPLAGIAFDIEDFTGTGTLSGLSGLRITPLDPDPSVSSGEGSIDLIAIGFNADAAAVPEPSAIFGLFVLLGSGRLIKRRLDETTK